MLKKHTNLHFTLCFTLFEMEGIKHFSHEHPLILSKYQNSPADARCRGCGDPIIVNTSVYHCSTTSSQHSSCTDYFLHETCSTLPLYTQHDIHIEHVLTLDSGIDEFLMCENCDTLFSKQFLYYCRSCRRFFLCLRCWSRERDLNHPSHRHTLTLLPRQISLFCDACGTEGGKDFSYLCKICLFWIHKRCASAPPKLIFKAHHNEHPLVLDYSLPEEYRWFGVSCTLCREEVDSSLWLYYCADCRYFAHIKCVLESGEDPNINEDVEDADDPDLVHFPVSEKNPFLLYQLIQKFAENFSTSSTEEISGGKAVEISHCGNGHSLILLDNDFYNKIVGETQSSSDHMMICDGCVQPIVSPPPDSFYGCLDCNFFLHNICAAELPREFEHASHPQHKLIRCDQIGKPSAFFLCSCCDKRCNGIFYHCESCKIYIDLVCAAMPSEIKHDSHKHKLKYAKKYMRCEGCDHGSRSNFICTTCNYKIGACCVRKPGRIKHRWDEHQLCLVYPPVKGHPHDFNCELCSEDINPNSWFYHCRECDTSFHDRCLDQCAFSNIKLGAIVKDDQLHQHSLKISPPAVPFKCGRCGRNNDAYRWKYYTRPTLTCVSCKFLGCGVCAFKILNY